MAEEQAERHVAGLLFVDRGLELQARLARGQRDDEQGIREVVFAYHLGGTHEGGRHLLELAAAAAREQRDDRQLARQRELLAHGIAVGLERNHVSQRMADVGDRNAGLLVERRFHRKQGQDTRYGAPDLLDPAATPGPDRRADVVDGTDSSLLEVGFEPEVEVGSIDADEDIRLQVEKALLQLAANAGDLARVLQRIDVAHHRELVHGPPGVETLRLHGRPADAEEDGIGQATLERRDQVSPQEIAGSLPGHQGNPYCLAHQRIMLRFEDSRKSTIAWTSGWVFACSASLALASSSSSPDL